MDGGSYGQKMELIGDRRLMMGREWFLGHSYGHKCVERKEYTTNTQTGGIMGSPELPSLLTPSIAQRPNAEGDYPSRDPGDQSRPVWQSPDDLSREIGTEALQQETSCDADGADESPVDPRDSPGTPPVPNG